MFYTSASISLFIQAKREENKAFVVVCSYSLRLFQCARTFTPRGMFALSLNSFCLFLSFFFSFLSGAKERNIAPQLTDFEIPTSFWYELKSLTETMMENVNCESSFIKLTGILVLVVPWIGKTCSWPTEMENRNIAEQKLLSFASSVFIH